MKFIVIFVILATFVTNSWSWKNPACGLPHSLDGDGVIKCTAYMPGWSYNLASNECVSFVYGGCGGNANRFGTKQKCMEKCVK